MLDEHGNQIMISGAEQLKKLAASVNEIKQSDGSVIKEYILNDPKVIEQIRNHMRSNSNSSNQKLSLSSTNSPKFANTLPNPASSPKYLKTYETNTLKTSTVATSLPPMNPVRPLNNSSSNNENSRYSNRQQNIQNDTSADRFSPLPSLNSTITPSTPYVSQVQQQINRFQQQQKLQQHQHQQNQINNFNAQQANLKKPDITNNSSKIVNEKLQLSNFNVKHKLPVEKVDLEKREEIEEEELSDLTQKFKQIHPNKFELRTSKGKALQFTITSEDSTESDIEEVKSMLHRRFIKTKDQNYHQSNDHANFNSSTFQPKPPSTNQSSQHPSKPVAAIPQSISNQQNDALHRPNNNTRSNLPVYLSYLNHAKSIANMNMIDFAKAMPQTSNELKNISKNSNKTKSINNLADLIPESKNLNIFDDNKLYETLPAKNTNQQLTDHREKSLMKIRVKLFKTLTK